MSGGEGRVGTFEGKTHTTGDGILSSSSRAEARQEPPLPVPY